MGVNRKQSSARSRAACNSKGQLGSSRVVEAGRLCLCWDEEKARHGSGTEAMGNKGMLRIKIKLDVNVP